MGELRIEGKVKSIEKKYKNTEDTDKEEAIITIESDLGRTVKIIGEIEIIQGFKPKLDVRVSVYHEQKTLNESINLLDKDSEKRIPVKPLKKKKV